MVSPPSRASGQSGQDKERFSRPALWAAAASVVSISAMNDDISVLYEEFSWIVVDRCGVLLDRCGSLWSGMERCGALL